jgi:PAS domain S-box-containing protein
MIAATATLANLSGTSQPLQPLPVTTQDEIGELIGGFNRLLETLAQRQEALEESERSLSESEARFRSLTEMSSDFYWESDAEHRLTARGSANTKPSTVSIFRKGAQIGERRWEIPHLSPDEAGWRAHRAMLEAHLPFRNFELSRLGIDGTERKISISGDPVFDSSGGFKGYRGVGADITERKRSEEAVKELGLEIALLLNSVGEGIYSVDLEGNATLINPAAAKLLGWRAEELLGKHIHGVIHHTKPDGSPYASEDCPAYKSFRSGQVQHVDNEVFWRKDGTSFAVDYTSTPILDENNSSIGAIVVFNDITERAQAEAQRAQLEAQLRESQKMEAIGTLAGGIAHDFNNILATILGNVELTRQDVSTNLLALESLEEIRKAAARARDLVQQILSFSRRQATKRDPIALTPVVEESVRLLRATLAARLALDVRCDTDLPYALADVNQIKQILINLVTNAMQAMPSRPGRIGIRLDAVMLDAALAEAQPVLRAMYEKRPGRALRLAVSDDGPGMDAATRGRIFEPFFTTKSVDEGTGLGLSVVHGIVQAHEGAIAVESAPGKGTTFTLYLPAAETQAGTPAPAPGERAAAPDPGGGRHMLYVDDDESLVLLVRRLLERRGYRISGYTVQSEALAALRADPAAFDLVVSDYNMPGMSGLDVAREVHAIRADLPVAIASGFIDEELRAQADGAGVRELIFKADTAEDLCEAFVRLAQTAGKQSKSS